MINSINTFDRIDIKNAYLGMYAKTPINESVNEDSFENDYVNAGGDSDDFDLPSPKHHKVIFKKWHYPEYMTKDNPSLLNGGGYEVVAWFPDEKYVFDVSTGHGECDNEIVQEWPDASAEEYADVLDYLKNNVYLEKDGDFLDIQTSECTNEANDADLEKDYVDAGGDSDDFDIPDRYPSTEEIKKEWDRYVDERTARNPAFEPCINTADGGVMYIKYNTDTNSFEYGENAGGRIAPVGSVKYDMDYSLEANLNTVVDEIVDKYGTYSGDDERQ